MATVAEKTIGAIYERDVREHMLADAAYSGGKENPTPAPELIVGVELEIENWDSRTKPLTGWYYTEDGSLRNNGKEVISYPTKSKLLQNHLEVLFKHHQITEGEDHYTERCSTHVHMNVQDYSYSELRVLCTLYQIVERLLFGYVGHDRKDSIFCVPWYESGITHKILDKMSRSCDSTVGNWVKYSALNLLPVRDKGTVEFRHLHGTCNVETIMNWVGLIGRLHLFSKGTKLKELTDVVLAMNTVSNYDVFLGEVFKEQTGLLTSIPGYQEALSVGVVDAKLMLMKPRKGGKEKSENEVDFLREIINAENARRARPLRPSLRNVWGPPTVRNNDTPIVIALIEQWNQLEREQINLRPGVLPNGDIDWSIAAARHDEILNEKQVLEREIARLREGQF